MKLKGKTALITGGGSGLGFAFAKRLAQDGANIVIADIRGASDAAKILQESDFNAVGVALDVSQEESVIAAVDVVNSSYGGVDILVNNAALFSTLVNKPFDEIDSAEWMKVMTVNTLGPFLCAKHFSPHMKQKKWGRIINVASTSALKGVANMAHYVTSKGAVITSNALAPGLTLSDQILKNSKHVEQFSELSRKSRAIQRDATPSDLIGTVSFLASDDAAFMTGQTLCVEGGAIFV